MLMQHTYPMADMQSQRPSLLQTQQLQMILAPQLRQSLEMLQLPILELRTMIQKEIEQNPTLEESLEPTPPDEAEEVQAEADDPVPPQVQAPEPVVIDTPPS